MLGPKEEQSAVVGDAGEGKRPSSKGWRDDRAAEVQRVLGAEIVPRLGALLQAPSFALTSRTAVKAVLNELSSAKRGAVLYELHTVSRGAARRTLTRPSAQTALRDGRGLHRRHHIRRVSQHSSAIALARRFQEIEVLEPSLEETVLILKGLQSRYEEFHAVKYSEAAIQAAGTLAHRHLHDRKLPDKAIDLMDEAGADAKLETGPGTVVEVERIEQVVARMAQIPPRQVSSSTRLAQEPRIRPAAVCSDRTVHSGDRYRDKLSRAGSPAEKRSELLVTGRRRRKTEVSAPARQTMGIELTAST